MVHSAQHIGLPSEAESVSLEKRVHSRLPQQSYPHPLLGPIKATPSPCTVRLHDWIGRKLGLLG